MYVCIYVYRYVYMYLRTMYVCTYSSMSLNGDHSALCSSPWKEIFNGVNAYMGQRVRVSARKKSGSNIFYRSCAIKPIVLDATSEISVIPDFFCLLPYSILSFLWFFILIKIYLRAHQKYILVEIEFFHILKNRPKIPYGSKVT